MFGKIVLLCFSLLVIEVGTVVPTSNAAAACTAVQAKFRVDPQTNRAHQIVVDRHVAFGQVPEQHYAYAACLYDIGRVVLLEPQDGFTDLHYDSLRSAGPYFAYVYGKDDFDTDFVIGSVDLRTGRYVHMSEFFDRYAGAGIEDLVLKSNGSIAWIAIDSLERRTVRIADRHGNHAPRHGHRVVGHSLRLRGSRIFWRQGHTTRSTRLY